MEFGERKRRRKSQSFKLVTDEDLDSSYVMNSSSRDVNGQIWMGDESMGIKKQITGMMRLLGDKTGSFPLCSEAEHNGSTKDGKVTCRHTPSILSFVSDGRQSQSWNSVGGTEPPPSSTSTSLANGPGCGQQSTCSRGLTNENTTKDLIKPVATKADGLHPPVPEIPCCMCNCKGTLQAILHELRAMRRIMQNQKGTSARREQAKSFQSYISLGSASCRKAQKRKVAPLSVCSTRRKALSCLGASHQKDKSTEAAKKEEYEKLESCTISGDVPELLPQNDQVADCVKKSSLLNQLREHQALESEVRLAEDYDVFISKAQLDSILINYTRSGSLLFRKLVCAFFDDATLANSVPNGKRKRGLNDNRKGLDQNIVGAIKVFTEKYCTEHRIEKLPGPRDWVQILQDQIKLARRRLKRGFLLFVINATSFTSYILSTKSSICLIRLQLL
ncbi:BEN domain-containing protein 7 [Cyprinodon tularosa]|uniref:BEN domain-containing protein 7 n=1 Tax=Cyprinodon tularosa TaxID=77115 RepID=UPI0018E26E90|nr:BEN domain-containing protein 7 [Cyprinodon tularosa]